MTSPYPGNADWPSDWQPCILTGHFVGLDGQPAAGEQVSLQAPISRMVLAGSNTIVLARTLFITLDAHGSFSIKVPATNDPDTMPTNWQYLFSDPDGNTFPLDAPQGATVDVADVANGYVQLPDGRTYAKGDPGAPGGAFALGSPQFQAAVLATPGVGGGGAGTPETYGFSIDPVAQSFRVDQTRTIGGVATKVNRTPEMVARSALGYPSTPQGNKLRIGGAVDFGAIARWLENPSGEMCVLNLGDSTTFSPNTVEGGPLGGAVAGSTGNYVRYADQLALITALAYPSIRVELDVLDYVNQPLGLLGAATVAGATSFTSSTLYPNGTVVEIERGGNRAETVTITGAPTGSGPYTHTVAAMTNAHPTGVTLSGPGAPADPATPTYQTTRVLNAGSGKPYANLPGSTGYMLSHAVTPYNRLQGSETVFFSTWVTADDDQGWTPSTAKNLWARSGSVGNYGQWMYLNPTGTLGFRHSDNGTNLLTRTSTAVVPAPASGVSIALGVLAQANNGAGGQTFTFYTSPDGRNWTQLGDPIVAAGTHTWFNPPGIAWTVGSISPGGSVGANWKGKVYEINVRRDGIHGETILPMSPQDWQWGPFGGAINTTPLYGGPVLRFLTAGWPGKGLDEFDNHRYLSEMVPQRHYGAVLINTGHNDIPYLGTTLYAKWDRLLARLEDRIGGAEVGVVLQNATVRNDGPTGALNPNPAAYRNDHLKRMADLNAYADQRGLPTIDHMRLFYDYVAGCASKIRDPVPLKPTGNAAGDGTLFDLLHYTGDTGADQVGVHPKDGVYAGTGLRAPGGCYLQAMLTFERLTTG